MADGRGSPRPHLAAAPDDLERIREGISRALLRVCPWWLRAEREEILHSAIVRVLELQSRREERIRTASYLWKAAYSATADEIRRRRRTRETSLEDTVAEQRPDGRTPETTLLEREKGAALRDCMAGLIEPRRVAVMLHLQGCSMREGAALAGWTVKRFDNLLYRGVADLRRCLAAKGWIR